ncbi:hypothetical protein T310_8748, partial [Rasamsonia emersonii CBS 393.64]
ERQDLGSEGSDNNPSTAGADGASIRIPMDAALPFSTRRLTAADSHTPGRLLTRRGRLDTQGLVQEFPGVRTRERTIESSAACFLLESDQVLRPWQAWLFSACRGGFRPKRAAMRRIV